MILMRITSGSLNLPKSLSPNFEIVIKIKLNDFSNPLNMLFLIGLL